MEHHPVTEPLHRPPAVLHGDPLDEPAEPIGQLGRRRISLFLGEAGVPGDVEEAHRRRVFEAAVHPGRSQLGLEPLDDVPAPRLGLLQVVHADHGLLTQDTHPIAELDPENLVRPLAGRHGRRNDLGLPHPRLRLCDATKAVGLDPHQSLDAGRLESRSERQLDDRDMGQFFFPHSIVGRCGGQSGGVADLQEQVDRRPGPLRELGERHVGERRQPFEGGCVEEIERDEAVPNGVCEAVERNPRLDQAADQTRTAHVAWPISTVGVGLDNPQIDQSDAARRP